MIPGLSLTDIDNVIDSLCAISAWHDVFYLWKPVLHNSKDDMVLEAAVTAQCDAIVTHNVRHFKDVAKFGVRVLTPREALLEAGQL